ncbi:dihydroxyacetone kinase subunit DhaK [Nocardioidaceae bacterium]|nr:dihydroxyacetone kinase subunit DhaK [Nocardioidaceae bacterium]
MATAAFFDDPSGTVAAMLEGLARTRPLRLCVDQGVRAVVRAEVPGDQVAVVSGGGSGHEPAHAGFVADGMLTAAVAGDFFASPSVEAVLATIREVTGEAGCLLVVKNYTGDRLNFGLAAERARAEGLEVEIVTVQDDVALPDNPEPRGLAGTVLVHKVAGHHARNGASLDDVAAAARSVAEGLATISLSLSSARLPGADRERRDAELGLGIHNEPGAREIDPASAGEALDLVLDPLLTAVADRHGGVTPLVALLNDTGGCSTQEMAVLARGLLDRLGDRCRVLVGPGPVMTSVDMHGFSVTLLPHTDDLTEALLSSVDTPDWPGASEPHAVEHFEPRRSESLELGRGDRDAEVGRRLRAACEALVDAESELDELDARTGDGDAGATVAAGARGVIEALEDDALSTGSTDVLAREIAQVVGRTMGGSSGVLLSILLSGTAAALEDGAAMPAALRQGLETVEQNGGAGTGQRTMVDALSPAADALDDGLDAAARAARQGADDTASMTEGIAGRSSYVQAKDLDGTVDPGAEAVARAIGAYADA